MGSEGLRIDPKKVAVVQDWPVPKDRNALQKFWGLANHFRKFIIGWATLVSPLQLLLKKPDTFHWDDACETAFAGIKKALCTAPVLALPDLSDIAPPFEVICDDSGVGMGAVLMQAGRPIAFDGKHLSPAEQNYHVGEQELLAVIHALELWRCYLDSQTFVVVTDHSPNIFFADKKVLSPRQTRWAERLSRFQFTWEYRPGRINVADPLSRHPSFEVTATLASITSGISRLALPNNAVLSAVATAIPSAAPVADSSVPAPAAVDAENAAAAAADQDMPSMIIQGYSDDPWFAHQRR